MIAQRLVWPPGTLRSAGRAFVVAAVLIVPARLVCAQQATSEPPAPLVPATTANLNPPGSIAANGYTLPANTIVELDTVDAVSSKTSARGDFFKLRVAVPVKSGDTVLIPAGTPVVGQIVHAAKSGGGGKSGELILAARYIDAPQGQIKLRSSFGAAGVDRTRTSLAVSLAIGPFALFIRGKEVELPAGSPLSARIAADTAIAQTP